MPQAERNSCVTFGSGFLGLRRGLIVAERMGPFDDPLIAASHPRLVTTWRECGGLENRLLAMYGPWLWLLLKMH